jgi:hypothetical protein
MGTSAILLAGLAGSANAAAIPDSEQVAKLLSEAKTMAFQLKEDAAALEGYMQMNVSWESHAATINRPPRALRRRIWSRLPWLVGRITTAFRSERPSAACEKNERIETLLPIARFDDLGLRMIKLSPKHLELAAVRTSHFDARFLAVDKNPLRVRTAACADDVALAPLRIDRTCVFHAFYLARELPLESDSDAHHRTRRLLNDSIGVGAETPERRLDRAASNNQQIGPFLPGFFSYRARHLAHSNSQGHLDTSGIPPGL